MRRHSRRLRRAPRPAAARPPARSVSTGRSTLVGLTALTALVLLTACGGDDGEAGATTTPTSGTSVTVNSATTAATATTATSVALSPPSDTGDPPPIGTGDLPPIGTGDLPPIGTGDLPMPPVSSDVPYALSVTVGVDAAPERIERVPLGATVSIALTNPSAADEFHLHGYDLGDGQVIPAGETATFTFVADRAGSFELESHETGDVLMILEVI
ncbi:MAG: hypothetical protein ACK5CE_22255 [Actinomycetes bacterium]|jgi:hypothetical protein|uniref:Unannotated protein n=1 Tax=freshwater metagenome TaxID=449393 RepID=A0A6J6CGZ0_9ZZZZ|nr:hypothetical protein [Actinomycetota bacterium]